jgi:hypothetical protein
VNPSDLTADDERDVIAQIALSPGLIGITAQLLGARLRLEGIRKRATSEGRGAR